MYFSNKRSSDQVQIILGLLPQGGIAIRLVCLLVCWFIYYFVRWCVLVFIRYLASGHRLQWQVSGGWGSIARAWRRWRPASTFSSLNLYSVECAVLHTEIRVDSLRPLYGPVSGGTRVTITGRFVSVSTITAVYIGQAKLQPVSNRLWFLYTHCRSCSTITNLSILHSVL